MDTTQQHYDSMVDISESAVRDVESYQAWATGYGVQTCEGFQLWSSEDGVDYSVWTNQDLPAASPVLYVPSDMILSGQQAIQIFNPTGQELEAAEILLKSLNVKDNERLLFYLMVHVLVEYEQGTQSAWYPWLNALPRQFFNGPSMTDVCFECLPPLVRSLASMQRTTCFNLCRTIADKVDCLSTETRNNDALLKWAFQIVATRSIQCEDDGDWKLIPLVDMLQHRGTEDASSIQSYDELTDVSIVWNEEGSCQVNTLQDIPAGAPLCRSYGDPTNPSWLFARYGFLDEAAPATFCKMLFPHVDDKLVNMGYQHNRMLFYKDTGDVSEEVWDVLLYQVLGENAARRREFYTAHMDGDIATKQRFHEQYWPQVSATLYEHVNGFLKQLDQLSAKAQSKDVNEHPRLPLILQHNQFVRETFEAVKARNFPGQE